MALQTTAMTTSAKVALCLVDFVGIEPTPAKDYIPRRTSQLIPEVHKFGGGRGYRTPLVKMLARQLRSPLLPPL